MPLTLFITIIKREQIENDGAIQLDLHMPIMTTPMTMRNLFIIGTEILLVKTQSTFKFTATKMLAEAMCSAFIHSIVRSLNFFLFVESDYKISLRHHGKNQHFEPMLSRNALSTRLYAFLLEILSF